jgi:zinc protease
MKTLALAVLFVLAQDIPDHPDKLQFKPLTFEVPKPDAIRTTLACGAAAYLIEDSSVPMVDLQIYIRGGAFWVPKGKEGLAGMTATLMRTGGTEKREPRVLDDELDFLGAHLSVALGDTNGTATLSILSKDLDHGLEILADVLRRPAFRQDKIDLLKAQTMEMLRARNDSTGSIESRETSLLLYGPDYPVNAYPTKASVESITREDLVEMHKRFFMPKNFIVAAAGDFKKAELAKKLDEVFAGWEGERPTLEVPQVTFEPKPGVYLFHKEGRNINQGRVMLGHRSIRYDHPDAFALRLLNYIYGGGGFSSRLTQKVRTDEGLAYTVHSSFTAGVLYDGTLRVLFSSKSESCLYAAKLCLKELERIQKDGVTEQELREAKQYFLDGFPGLFFATPFDTAKTLAAAELNGLPKDYYATYRDKIARVTAEDCKRAANEHVHADRFVVTFVGNVDAIRKGDGVHLVKLEELASGPVEPVPLPDPLTLERPK